MLADETTVTPMPAQPKPAPTTPFGITVGASPFTYTAPTDMDVVISGGAVSLVTFTRSVSAVALGLTSGIVHLNPGDKLTITWLVTKPSVTGIPR